VALFAGRLDEGERLAEEAVALNRRHGDDADQEHTVQRLALALERSDPSAVPLAALREYAARYPRLPVWRAMLARAEHALGHAGPARTAVAACARDGFAELLRTPDRLCGLVLLAEPVAAHGSPADVDALAAALTRQAGANAIMDAAWAAFGPAARAAGIVAAAAGRADEAAAHFGAAVALAARWGAPAWELAALSDWAESGAPGFPRERLAALAAELRSPAAGADRRSPPASGQTTTP
ncbi:MAG TPA: hypothetical protein VD836_03990, partial [Solirubrobacteraceae bacterium]|nr:hypothetical protein [Solirubrobacteraceae bacterium]